MDKEQNDVVFNKNQFINSNSFSIYKDIIQSIVYDYEEISKSELEKRLNKFLNKIV